MPGLSSWWVWLTYRAPYAYSVRDMDTELWLRNCHLWILEAVECRVGNIVFDVGSLIKRHMDPVRFMELHFPADLQWRLLVVHNFHADEFHSGQGAKPVAQWPCWNATKESWQGLVLLIEELEEKEIKDGRVLLCNLPDLRSGIGRRLLVDVADLQRDHPTVKLHIHGITAFHQGFSNEFGAIDLELRTAAAHKRIFLPNGKTIHVDWALQNLQWINMLGFSVPDLQVPRNRCIYNIKSALWAAENYRKNERFLSRHPNAHSGLSMGSPKVKLPYRGAPQDGDRFLCNLCSLQSTCQYFREGAVCAVPGSEPVELANFFKSRDSDTIITGLQTLLQFNARRVESMAAEEQRSGDYSKELSKLVDSLFDRGMRLAKLVDPKLANPKFAVILPGGAPMPGVQQHDPREVVKQIIIELEGRGIRREDITPDMLANILGAANPQQAIQNTVITQP